MSGSSIFRFKWSIGTIILVSVLVLYFGFKISNAIDSIKYALTPPELPEYQSLKMQYVNANGYKDEPSDWFHHASQGTATIPIPYAWLVALEAPKSNPWWLFFGEEELLIGEYMLRHGFIEQPASHSNPDGLPIGIAKTESIYFAGLNRKATAAGFTCAACHTGQLIYADKRYIIDGAPASTDLGLFTRSLGAALGQTVLSGKVNILNGRFDRFARRVLGSNDNIVTRNQLKDDLNETIEILAKSSDTIEVTEGFTRLDALNRIGNQVFNKDMSRPANYSPINAPVNYPHIWTTSWFNWVQYDGSIMQPLIRNAGEALGVSAYVDTTGPDAQRFASSVNYQSLVKMEDWLGGTTPKINGNQFNGLRAPDWPSSFPAIDSARAKQGEKLYQRLCQGCHLPSVDSAAFWEDRYWQPIRYQYLNTEMTTQEPYLTLNIIPLPHIGTDPAQARVLETRTVDTTGLNLTTQVCTPLQLTADGPAKLAYVPLKDSATANFGLALGAFVERTNQQWFKQSYISKSRQKQMEGARPNCLQVGAGYKARPLNGIWATAPFLHNGAVATIYDLLSTERPDFVMLGGQQFDVEKLGVLQTELVSHFSAKFATVEHAMTPDYQNGYFLLDTRQSGNNQSGHWFAYKTSGKQGIVGPELQEDQKYALIEYLKTL